MAAPHTDLLKEHRYHCSAAHLESEERPFGPLKEMFGWCAANIGPRHHLWSYRGGRQWSFLREEDMTLFMLAWF